MIVLHIHIERALVIPLEGDAPIAMYGETNLAQLLRRNASIAAPQGRLRSSRSQENFNWPLATRLAPVLDLKARPFEVRQGWQAEFPSVHPQARRAELLSHRSTQPEELPSAHR
jgi:hypothetical protein